VFQIILTEFPENRFYLQTDPIKLEKLLLLDSHLGVRYNRFVVGPVAQLGARLNRTEEVRGSNPLRSIDVPYLLTDVRNPCTIADTDQTKRKRHGPIAQLGARLNGIEKVEGSNPSGSTKTLIKPRSDRSTRSSAREVEEGVQVHQGVRRTPLQDQTRLSPAREIVLMKPQSTPGSPLQRPRVNPAHRAG
jgi:hypothetical protein